MTVVQINLFDRMASRGHNAAMNASTYSFAYDDIGNRLLSSVNAVPSSYTANSLNQYTSLTNAGVSVTVTYDLDGNMTRNGSLYYQWDGENNMKAAYPDGATNGSLRVDNGYDYMKRRVIKTVSVLTGYEPTVPPAPPGNPGEWVPVRTTRFVWDGWNIAAAITIDENTGTTNVTRFVWGLDLSGSIQGAGGVGGLLAEIKNDGSIYFACHDANGNITDYVDVYGTVRGHFEYNAFGETVATSCDLADTFRFRFSTKYHDDETGNDVYQQRQYIPPLGRWASRDPIDEHDSINLYQVVRNSVTINVDYLGLASWPWKAEESPNQPAITNNNTIQGGNAQITKWDVVPKTRRAWIFSSCCTIEIKAEGGVAFWWSVAPPRGELRLTPLQHETSHVRQFWLQWIALENDVTELTSGKMSCKRARCYQQVIENLRLARLNLAYAKGFDFDVRNGQNTLVERAEYQKKADDYFQKAVQKKKKCLEY